ncbi:hypothetical protein SAMN05421839_10119 [Halolactibacillus halophilus]|uniref:YceG-like family protein n=1 Tax=Halolactibacillus halophilus TaxID=306540 RepID=A0A1I5KS34_9BACI|nr:hypothetical protein [Halolactibacillus halophilus]GEM00486.1 hypothetical protein HHA03_00180 [Halolactibacillus halophilus]SFO87930.1 hypothetical protein SAMN05421839_10119 [Halolactibacillus halophilus]
MKQTLRAFSLGMLVATSIFSIHFFFFNEVKAPNTASPSNADMIKTLKNSGYNIYTDEALAEYIDAQLAEQTPTKENQNNDRETDESETSSTPEDETSSESVADNDQESSKETSSFILTIEPGMTITEVSNYLIIANLIESREQFVNYLSDNGYATNIQVGSFELNHDMPLAEVVEVIANKE